MIIDFGSAVEGEFYTIDETLRLDDALLGSRGGHFIDAARLTGWYTYLEGNLAVNCELTYKAEFECDRCLATVVKEFKVPVAESFFKEKLDEDTLTYEDEEVDLQPVIDERVLLAVPSQVLCKADCKGLCPVCGTDLNKESCNCNIITEDAEVSSPFSVLKNMNIESGGATNGSTKK